jgi:hypothetical protein
MSRAKIAALGMGILLSACRAETGTTISENDKVLQDAIALEKKTNEAINATVEQIEAQSQATFNLQSAQNATNTN